MKNTRFMSVLPGSIGTRRSITDSILGVKLPGRDLLWQTQYARNIFMDSNKIRRVWIGIYPVLLLVLLAAPRAARAENTYIKQAIGSYENFEYEEALRILSQAVEVPNSTKEELAQIHLYMGLVRFTLGDPAQAEKDFKQAVELNYNIKPPPDTSPKIVSEFQRVKKTVPPPEVKDPGGSVKPPGGNGIVITKPMPVPPRKRVWTWVVLGVGAGALVGGGVFGYLASSAKADFDKQDWADKAHDLKNTAESRALLANILFGAGGAAMAAALILFFTEGADQTAADQTSGLSITPTPLGFEATYRF
jgi:tetratricopeptide (TPR) repeat protein